MYFLSVVAIVDHI